jgi:AcrR family transcriptional regulator
MCTVWYMYRMVHSVAMRRQELLDAIVADLQREGIGDRSLRDIAAAVGTSHRMLIHHFGSRQGLLTEVVRRVESDQHLFLASLDLAPDEATVAMWRRLSEPALWPAERLFYECYARACRGEQPYATLLPGLVDDWLDRTVELGLTASERPGDERARARLGLAVFRGLLLDLVATGDRDGVDAAFEEFRALVDRDAAAARADSAAGAAAEGRSPGRSRGRVSSAPGRSRTRP